MPKSSRVRKVQRRSRFIGLKAVEKASALIPVIFVVSLFIALALISVFRNPVPSNSLLPPQKSDHQEAPTKTGQWPLLWGPKDSNCSENPNVKFTASPIEVQDITVIEPMGELREGHIVPGDHVGFEYKSSPSSTPVKVLAPAEGTIVRVERHPYTPPLGYLQNIRHYHLYLVHSCTVFTGFVHLTEFSPEILAGSVKLKQLDEKDNVPFTSILVDIPVKAGEMIGTAWTFGLLGVVTVDLNQTNKGYLKPESYKAENWRPHAVSFFEYLEEPLRSQVLAKSPRTAEPRGGKIDFDIEGKIVGNWFEEGSGGFRDETKEPALCGNFPCPYWGGHLSLVYDFIDPIQLRVSIGHDWGLIDRTPFGVRGNQPDFEKIGTSDGLVKYELVSLKDITKEKGYESNSTLITENDESKILGTFLIQMLDKETIKAEVFPGKSGKQVSAFTSQARLYRR